MHILVTAGPTREYIDPVRFISNSSSGRMGYAIAQAAASRGHKVTLISGPVQLTPPKGVRLVPVMSAQEMLDAATVAFPKTDAVIMAAAVGDYRPIKRHKHKIKKEYGGEDRLLLELVPTPDIIAHLGRHKRDAQILIGFALEDRAGHDHALEKFSRKNLDAIVLNDPEAMGSPRDHVQIYTREWEWQQWPEMTKIALGGRLIRLAEKLFEIQKKK
jgi:phosphopantothenoylcysteine decarboxylase/phosphopantothenate--cysteine ligase